MKSASRSPKWLCPFSVVTATADQRCGPHGRAAHGSVCIGTLMLTLDFHYPFTLPSHVSFFIFPPLYGRLPSLFSSFWDLVQFDTLIHKTPFGHLGV